MDGQTDKFAISISRVKPTMPGCQSIPQRKPDALVTNSETGNMGLKNVGLACPIAVCVMRCAPLEIVVPRQEEISGAATDSYVMC